MVLLRQCGNAQNLKINNMENYWNGFCRKNNKYFGNVPMSIILESFYWYCQGDIERSDEGLKVSYDREIAKPLDLDKKGLLPCPNCGCRDLSHHYVYIKCNKCLMCGRIDCKTLLETLREVSPI